jgi:hypothetical protein
MDWKCRLRLALLEDHVIKRKQMYRQAEQGREARALIK